MRPPSTGYAVRVPLKPCCAIQLSAASRCVNTPGGNGDFGPLKIQMRLMGARGGPSAPSSATAEAGAMAARAMAAEQPA